MILITNPFTVKDEIYLINSLFEEGLPLLHIRKPDFSKQETAHFIHRIKLEYRPNLVLHNHHQLADDFGINRIHFSERDRKNGFGNTFKNKITSTSTHGIEDFNALENTFEYTFLSPVFKSISKENYLPNTNFFEALKSRTNFKTKIVALGGIDSENILEALKSGFDDVALLGAIWNNENPLKQFKLCQKSARTYSL